MTTSVDISTGLSPSGEGITVWANGEYLATHPWHDLCEEVIESCDLKALEIWKNQLTDLIVEMEKAIAKVRTTRIFFAIGQPGDFREVSDAYATTPTGWNYTYDNYYDISSQLGVGGDLIYMIIDDICKPVAQWDISTSRWEIIPLQFSNKD